MHLFIPPSCHSRFFSRVSNYCWMHIILLQITLPTHVYFFTFYYQVDKIKESSLGTVEAYVNGAIGELRQLVINGVGALVGPIDLLTRNTLLDRSPFDLIAGIRKKIECAIEKDKNSGRMVGGSFKVEIDKRLYAYQRIVQDIEGVLTDSAMRAQGHSRESPEHTVVDVDEEVSQRAVYDSLIKYLDYCRTKSTKPIVTKAVQSHGVLSDKDREWLALAADFKGFFPLVFPIFLYGPQYHVTEESL